MKKTSYKSGGGKARYRTYFHGNKFANGSMKGSKQKEIEAMLRDMEERNRGHSNQGK